jgi:hypothetical protein
MQVYSFWDLPKPPIIEPRESPCCPQAGPPFCDYHRAKYQWAEDSMKPRLDVTG